MSASRENRLKADNDKLRRALARVIPWVGMPAEGPSWATPEAKARNRDMCEKAFREACSCFPEDYNSIRSLTEQN